MIFTRSSEAWKSGQRVAFAGAFLLDAETRLNPSLAAGYFGAGRGERTAGPGPLASAASREKLPAAQVPRSSRPWIARWPSARSSAP